jgi:glutaredoxin-like protein NrdH
MSITVYSKPACVQCTATTRALDRHGIEYRIVDVSNGRPSFATRPGPWLSARFLSLIAGDQHWAGFRPDKIGALA